AAVLLDAEAVPLALEPRGAVALVDRDADAGLLEALRQAQACDPAADDQHVQRDACRGEVIVAHRLLLLGTNGACWPVWSQAPRRSPLTRAGSTNVRGVIATAAWSGRAAGWAGGRTSQGVGIYKGPPVTLDSPTALLGQRHCSIPPGSASS